MSFATAIAAAVTLLVAVLASGVLRSRRRRSHAPDGLDLGPATAHARAGAKALAIRLHERIPMHLPLPRPGSPSRRLGLLLGLR